MWHSKSIEQRLEAIVEVSTVDNGSGLLSPEEDHVEAARKLMRPVNNRNKSETTQTHEKEERLERSRYLDLATAKNPLWKRVTLGLMELWRLSAQRLKLGVDGNPNAVLFPRTAV